MKVKLTQLLPVSSIQDLIEVVDVKLDIVKGTATIFCKAKNESFTIVSNVNTVKNLFPNQPQGRGEDKLMTVRNRAPKEPAIDTISDDEMGSLMEMKLGALSQGVVKNTRRIKCPATGEMITSEQYQANKKAGKYNGIQLPNSKKK